MTFGTLRRMAATLALVAPLTAAQAAEQSALSPDAFAQGFAAFAAVPEPAPAPEAVDVGTITHTHAPSRPDTAPFARGGASYYAAKFHGRRTASGERFDNTALTAAHRTLPFGSKVRVTNPANGRSVVVRINDRGPFHKSRAIDVSHAAAQQLGLIARGHGTVELALLD
ncbi:septal ring lytic transglycosylase RlpA family protein [Qipengyuania sediminis]|uniref:septal ring lytic transglycosylase RlpA family protein n=1 Tax=Qipengyuania sediminis TaxID=1532023 RepID=UPI00105A27AD|nr:septal ring lytic transglycosylase RlpA family protein [Qipengyuania sediminis]